MKSVIRKTETSQSDGMPIECYLFTHNDKKFAYTSDAQDVTVSMDGDPVKFSADTIKRESIIPGNNNSVEDILVHMARDSKVTNLFMGPPPETPVKLEVFRLHDDSLSLYDTVVRATISQVDFTDSECVMHCTMDAWLNKELPNGMNQYYCNWALFDKNCGLSREAYTKTFKTSSIDSLRLNLFALDLEPEPDGFYTGGCVYTDSDTRMIESQSGSIVTLRYPSRVQVYDDVKITPGCDGLFSTCANKFNNTENFSGVPYTPPTDPEKNPTGGGTYWIDSKVIQRDSDGFVGTISL